MATRIIIKEGNETLRKKAKEVTVFDKKLHTLLDDMKETMALAEGVGLAAPQVSILKRVAIIDAENEYFEMINPLIIKTDGSQTEYEGCLSVDSDKNKEITRPMEVTFSAMDRNGKKYIKTVSGLTARAVCHENDHLDGILFIDR